MKPSEQIENAQVELHDSVRKAIESFTEKTGLIVCGVHWEVAFALNESGHTKAVEYYHVRSDFQSGFLDAK